MSPRISSAVRSCALLVLAAMTGCGDDARPAPNAPDAPTAPDAAPDKPRAPDVAQTQNGPVQAKDAAGVRSYFAIPYAAPPVGELRWKPPAAPANWTTALANAASAAPCIQTSASPFRLTGDKEDCLYLDVHAPTGDGPFPVLVWFHGGAFNTGGTVTYADASPLVSKGAIVVTVGYRLGPLGFLGHPALRATDDSVGNYGIMDQQAALHWVQDNIAAFAGDKQNVTIFGESAGGFSVMTHLASPLSKDLFHKAIVESGGYAFDRQLPRAMLESNSVTAVTNALAAAGKTCTTVDAACLRSLTDEQVRTFLGPAFNAIPVFSSPVPSIDGKVLTKSIKQTFIDGGNNKVPLINGSNKDEWALFVAIAEVGARNQATPPNRDPANTTFSIQASAYAAQLGAIVGSASLGTVIAGSYPLASFGANVALQPSLGVSAAGTDVAFACPALNLSKRAALQTTPIWMYEFRDRTALPLIGLENGEYFLSFSQGAAHSYELQYLFGLRDLETDERRALRDAMTRYWTNFAKTGDPNTGVAPAVAWPLFTGTDKVVLGLDVASGGGIKPLEAAFETAHKCSDVWASLTF